MSAGLALVLAPAFLALFCFLAAFLLQGLLEEQSRKSELPTLLILTLIIFSFYFSHIMVKGSYDAQTSCSMVPNLTTVAFSDAANYTERVTYMESCTTTVKQSATMLYTMIVWLWRILPWAWLLFLIYWVFRGLADKEKLTRI